MTVDLDTVEVGKVPALGFHLEVRRRHDTDPNVCVKCGGTGLRPVRDNRWATAHFAACDCEF